MTRAYVLRPRRTGWAGSKAGQSSEFGRHGRQIGYGQLCIVLRRLDQMQPRQAAPKQWLQQSYFLSSNIEKNRRTRNQRKMCLEAKRAVSSFGEENESARAQEEVAHLEPAVSSVKCLILRFIVSATLGLPMEPSQYHIAPLPVPLQSLHHEYWCPGHLSQHPCRAGSTSYPQDWPHGTLR